MTSVAEIERAVAELPPEALEEFRAWFEQFDAARLDSRIEADALAGRLDRFASEALAEFRAGDLREL